MLQTIAFPTPDQLKELALQLQMKVPVDWEDRNGHVGVQHYLQLYELGAWNVLHEIGVDQAWFKEQERSQFDLEHHLNYRAEIHAGDDISTYNRVVGKSEKRFHGMYFVVNDNTGRLACTIEYITAQIDMRTRRMASFPEPLSGGLDRLYEKHQALSWPPPLCGVLNP
jgi:acyl-CoA thioester hydrolase